MTASAMKLSFPDYSLKNKNLSQLLNLPKSVLVDKVTESGIKCIAAA